MTFFPNVSLTIRRYGIATAAAPTIGGYYEGGKWVQGAPVTADFAIKASLQPASGKDMQTLSEGRRVKEMYHCFASVPIYTTDPLAAMNPNAATNRDEVIWDGRVFEVIKAAQWTNGLIPHYDFYILREEEFNQVNLPEA